MPITPSIGERIFSVAEIERSQIALGLRLRQCGLDLPLFAIDDVELTLRRLQCGLCLAFDGDCFLIVCVGLFEALDRGKPIGAQRAIAVKVILAAGDLGGRRRDFGGRLLDHCGLQPARGLAIGDGGFLGDDVGFRPRQLGAIVAIVELHQEVAGLDLLVVRNRDDVDKASDLRCDGGDFAAHISVVGRFHETAERPPRIAVPGSGCEEAENRGDQAEAFCDLPQRTPSRPATLRDNADNTVHCCLQKERMPKESICTYLPI